jgi:trk system potassium uptake protein TrkH
MNLNIRLVTKIIGVISIIIGTAMLPCIVVSLVYAEYDMTAVFGGLAAGLLSVGLLVYLPSRGVRSNIRIREGLLIVAVCWLLISTLGALPYVVSGEMDSFIDAFFESVSSFTTTSATLIPSFSDLPSSLLFWRSLSTWLGGMGIIIFAISILPALGIGTFNLANAESSSVILYDKIKNRMSDAAKSAYLLYLSLTIIEFLLLFVSEMDAFDAIVHTFGSMANGAVSNYDAGIMHFDSLYVEIIVSFFCILSSLNFISYKLLIQRRFKDFFKEAEIRYFFVILGTVMLVTVLVLWIQGDYGGFFSTLRGSFSQIIAFITTAGFATVDYSAWPIFCKALMFGVLFIGGCSASTSGGIKIHRFAVVMGLIRRNIYKRLHPNAVVAVKVGNKPISSDSVSNITVFVMVFVLTFGVGSLLLSLDGERASTTASAVLACLSNAGLGFGEIGFGQGFEVFSTGGRALLSLLMLVGRLELFTIILLLTPNFWRPDR